MLMICIGCSEDGERSRQTVAAGPEATFARLERELLDANGFELKYVITSEGAFECALSGSLLVKPGNVLELYSVGSFGADSVNASIRSDGETMWIIVANDTAESPTPVALNEAVTIGLTRMGLLHNLARLVNAAPPDRAGGSVRDWVTVSGFTVPESGKSDLPTPIAFRLEVAGVPSGEATLWIDESNWLPVERLQRVQFPDGEMVVSEKFRRL